MAVTIPISGSTQINGLRDEVTFADLADKISEQLASVDDSNPAGLSGTMKFNSIKNWVTIDALASYIKGRQSVPAPAEPTGAVVVGTQKTNGTTDAATVDNVVKFIMTDLSLTGALDALTLDDTAHTTGGARTSNILGATATSVLSLQSGALPTGMTLTSATRVISGTPTVVGTYNFTLRETLAGQSNSPRDTALSIVIS